MGIGAVLMDDQPNIRPGDRLIVGADPADVELRVPTLWNRIRWWRARRRQTYRVKRATSTTVTVRERWRVHPWWRRWRFTRRKTQISIGMIQGDDEEMARTLDRAIGDWERRSSRRFGGGSK